MAIVTLTTDWKKNDFYPGALKGKLFSQAPEARLVDISHQIQAFNLAEAAFVLRSSFAAFPPGTIHIVGVKSDTRKRHPFIVVRYKGQYFIGADNGVFSMLFDEQPGLIIQLNTEQFAEPYQSFPELTLFIEAAIHILKNGNLEDLGTKAGDVFRQPEFMPTLEGSRIVGRVIYIDSYQNVITNISRPMFHEVGKGRRFDIFVQSRYNRISEISPTYSAKPEGELVALFNSAGLLELALNYGAMAEMLNLDTQSSVRIDFYNEEDDTLEMRPTK